MTDLVASGYPSNAARTNAEMKVVLDDYRDIFAEHMGGAARTELTIAGGAITPLKGAGGGTHTVDTEGNAAADDLTNMITTNVPEGRYIQLYAENAARVVTIKDAAGGAGQYILADGNDFVYASINSWVRFQRRSTDLVEVARYVPMADLTAITTLATDDLILIWDTSANAFVKATQANALKPTAVETLTAGTAATYNTQAGAKVLTIEGWGPGAGSGGVDGNIGETALSGPGAGGGYFRKRITSPAASYTYTVGVGGAAGAAGANNGAAGTSTTFTDGAAVNLVAASGGFGGGSGSTVGNAANEGAIGGAATGGDVNYTGGDAGSRSIVGGVVAGLPISGAAPLIGGGVRAITGGAGAAGRVPGEGGGAAHSNNASNFAGAAGFRGEIKITTEF